MKTAFRLIVLLALVGGWTLAALALHVVRSTNLASGQERWLVVPKGRLAFDGTYVDVRHWTPADVGAHPVVVGRLIETGKVDVLAPAAPEDQRSRLVEFLRETLANPPAPTTVPATQPQ